MNAPPSHLTDPHGWRQEANDLMAAIAGGAIVGMPLLYTMEMWWRGMTLSVPHQLILLTVILILNVFFSIISGFRYGSSLPEAAMEAVTSVGIGLVFSFLILFLIGEITTGLAPGEIAGKVLIEAAVVSIGVSFANAQVRGRRRTGDDAPQPDAPPAGPRDDNPARLQLQADLRDAAAALIGALVFTLNLAPTEEIVMIATRLSPLRLLLLLGAALVLCHLILFASGFEEHHVHVKSVFQNPYAETLMTCAISLLVAAGLLWLIGVPAITQSPATAVASTITLGLPAIVGGAAGRVIV